MSLYSFTECLDAQGILIFLLLFLLITDIVKNKKPKNFPPGPWGLPFVGNVFNIDFKQLHISTAKLAEIYGNVYSLRLGRNKAVFVTGYKMVKEALINQAETFAARPPSPTMERLYSNYGLFFSNGYLWKKQRRFVLSTLRNFGLGRKTLESVISEESRFLQQAIEDEQGKPFNPHFLLNNAVSNIICSMVFGRRFDYSDNRFQRLLHLLSETMHLEGTIWTLLYEAFPVILKYLPGPHNRVFKNYEELQAFVGEEVERHKEDWDPSAPRDYIDSYLAEIQKNIPKQLVYSEAREFCVLWHSFGEKTKNAGTHDYLVPLSPTEQRLRQNLALLEQHCQTWAPTVNLVKTRVMVFQKKSQTSGKQNKEDIEAGFHEKNLVLCTLDLFIAGTETTSTSLRWALLYMIKHPEIQKKVQAEIESVLGQGRQPSMTNKPNMSYTDAVIHEIQRISNIVPLNTPRMTTKDTTLGGYFLPKGTPVMTNLTSVLFDKTEWQTPDSFNPGHFLDSEGKFVRREAFLPFSAGKRVCLGEQLARMELFLFFTSFLQNFTFKAPEGEEPSVEFQLGGILTPRPFKICAIPR